MSVLLGIDLGTTNSLGCVFRNGRIELIPNRFGSFLTPSVVSLDEEDKVLVGQIAKERLITCPERTASSFKKYMGEDRKITLGKRTFLPEELSSFVVRSIIEDAEVYLGEKVEEVIISVPAYFHDKQRYATKKAGILAGVTVKRLINEPSAAALAAYLADGEEQVFLVFDFGGGTLDVSIVDCFETVVEIVAVAGNNHLGGDNFHNLMVDSFLKEHGLSGKSISREELALLYKQAEACKIELTTEKSAKMNAWIGGKAYVSEYTNHRLLEESAGIFMKIKEVLTNAIKSAAIDKEELAGIVMAGGSSKMPIVSSYIEYLFQQQPVVDIHSDELIVRGLGYLCGVKARDESIKNYVLTDICPFSLGNATYNKSDVKNSYFSPIIQKNTVLPCSRVKRFYTVEDHQKEVYIEVLQGEHAYAKDNKKLAEYTVVVPDNRAGEEAVDIRFTYDIDGILIADVTVVSTGKTMTKIVSQTMDDKELEKRIRELEKLKVHPKDMDENKLLISRLEALFEEVGPQQREYISMLLHTFSNVLEEQDLRKIKRYREAYSNLVDQMGHYDPFAEYSFSEDFYQDEAEGEETEKKNQQEDSDFTEYRKKWTN